MVDVGDLLKGKTLTGTVIGIGVVILAPIAITVVSGVIKPALKATVKGGIVLVDRGRGVIAEVTETTKNLVAEARAEMGEGPVELGKEMPAPTRGERAEEAPRKISAVTKGAIKRSEPIS